MGKMKLDIPGLLSIKEAAEALARSRITIIRWMNAGILGTIQHGGSTVIPITEITRRKTELLKEEYKLELLLL